MALHPNSLANLRPPWKPGQSGGGTGRPRGTVYPAEWLKSLGSMTQGELEAIRNDPDDSVNRRAAAEIALQTIGTELTAKERRDAFAEIADRTTGKATQAIRVDPTPSNKTPMELIEELRRKHQIAPRSPVTLPPPEASPTQ